ncbi:MAG: orotidine-5'-phosphate decarboxylase, partial [Gammaproteobacteria bacterium]
MSQESLADPRVIVALDFADAGAALQFVSRLRPGTCRLKIGKELFTREGPELVRRIAGEGFDVFLDLKFHDIPNTVARACEAAAALEVWMLNVHASGGRKMMQAARTALEESAGRRPLLIAVT